MIGSQQARDGARATMAATGDLGPLESRSWPTDLVFEDHERAQGPDADLEFEFDPARVPRPRWTCG